MRSLGVAGAASVGWMLRQLALIGRVQELCLADALLDAALMYGSFAQGVGDRYSDVEFWFFHCAPVDGRAWCERIGPTNAIVVNEFGAHVVFFPGLIRGEFHFASTAEMAQVAAWPSDGASVDDMIVHDRTGELRELLLRRRPPDVPSSAADIEQLCLRFANWLVLGLHVLARGEVLRAHDALSHVHRHLLWMARVDADQTRTWLTPSRRAERELPPASAAQLRMAMAGDAIAQFANSWKAGQQLWRRLAVLHGFAIADVLWHEIDDRVVQIIADHHTDVARPNGKSEAPESE